MEQSELLSVRPSCLPVETRQLPLTCLAGKPVVVPWEAEDTFWP